MSFASEIDGDLWKLLGQTFSGQKGTDPFTKSACHELSGVDVAPATGEMLAVRAYKFVETKVAASGYVKGSSGTKNWRWEHWTEHQSRVGSEVALERTIAGLRLPEWVNQVPVCSGLVGTEDGRTAIDLVHRAGDSHELIELKISSNNPLHAAMEILRNGVLYLYSRANATRLGYDAKTPLMTTPRVELVVLAPADYYREYQLGGLERGLDGGLKAFVASKPELSVSAGFAFCQFANHADVARTAREIVAGEYARTYR